MEFYSTYTQYSKLERSEFTVFSVSKRQDCSEILEHEICKLWVPRMAVRIVKRRKGRECRKTGIYVIFQIILFIKIIFNSDGL